MEAEHLSRARPTAGGRSGGALAILIACCFFQGFPAAAPLAAQTPEPSTDTTAALRQELAALRAEYEQRIADLERRLTEMETAGTVAATPAPDQAGETSPAVAQAPPPVEPAPPDAGPAASPSPAAAANYFNPAISLIGNFLAVGGHNTVEELPAAEFRESELGLQAVIDPYGRADFFLAFGEEGVELEEGYATLTALPADLLVKVGRMRASFGKVNTLHLHTRPWPDAPLPITNLLGGEEGWIGTGVSAARLIPLPGDTFSEATLQVFRGDAEGLFEPERRSDLAYSLHYRLFKDLTDAANLDLGLSYGTGPNDTGADTDLQGLDFTYRWKPLKTGLYKAATVRGELLRSRREQPEGREDAVGWFLSGDWQFARRWTVGARIEAAERADDASRRDTGQALLLTFSPSEFSQLRGELRRREYSLADTATEALLQLQFTIGAHGAHPF